MTQRPGKTFSASISNLTLKAIVRVCLVCAILGFTFLAAMAPSPAEARDRSRFYSAKLLDDGRTVLFTYADAEYAVKSGSLFSSGGGRAHYSKDRKVIGLYHLEQRSTEVLLDFDTEPGSRGDGNFKIRSTRGRTALMVREPRQRGEEEEELPGGLFLLNVDAGDLTRIPVEEEMAGLHMEDLRSIWLAHEDGSLVFLAYAPGQKEGQKNSVPLGHVWLRSNTGSYELMTDYGGHDGTIEGELYFYDHNRRTTRAYSLETGEMRDVSRREAADLKFYNTHYGKPNRDVYVRVVRRGEGLELGRKNNGKWRYEPLPVDTDELR